MSNSNGHISIPVNIKADLGYVLGTGSGDLGYNIANGNINKWSRYKPVRLSLIDTATQLNAAKTAWLSSATWWKGSDGHCGLTIAEYSDLGSPYTGGTFFYFLRNAALSWTYNRPRGKANNEWFRAFDFHDYHHNAAAPVGAIDATDIWLDHNYAGQIDWDTAPADAYALNINDFSIGGIAITGNYYLGVLLYKSSGSTFYYLTSSTKIAAGQSISIPFTASQAMVGTWMLVPFISSRQYNIGADAQTGVYASCFGIAPVEVVIHAQGTIVDFTVFGVWNSAKTMVTYELVVKNNGPTSQTVTNVAVEVRSATGSQQPEEGQTEETDPIGTITVAGNSTVTRTGTINVTYNALYDWWIKGYADGFTTAAYEQIGENPD